MRCLGRIIALAVLITMVILIPCATWSIAIWNVAGNDETYTETIDRPAYETLAPITIPMLSGIAMGHLEKESADSGQATTTDSRELAFFLQMLDFIDIERWRGISAEIVTPEWVEAEIGGFMSGTLNYLHGESDTFDPIIDVTDIRTNLAGQRGQVFVSKLMGEIASWDECTPQQKLEYQQYFKDGQDAELLPKCQLEELNPYITRELSNAVQQIAAELPDDGRYVLRRELIDSGTATEAEFNMEMRDFRWFFLFLDNALVPLALLSVLAMLAIIIIVAVRSFKALFMWTGLAFVIGGLLNVLPLFSFLYGVSKPVQEELGGSTLESLVLEANFEVARSLTGSITLPILTVTFTLVLLGFIFLVLAAMVKNTSQNVQQFYYMPTSGGTLTPTPSPFGTQTPMPAPFASPTPPPSPFAPTKPPVAPPQIQDEKTTITPPPMPNASVEANKGRTALTDLDGQTFIEKRPDQS